MTGVRLGELSPIRLGLICLGCGIVLFAAVSVMNRRAVWLPLAEPLPLVAGESARFEFSPTRTGLHALQVEADDTLDPASRLRYLTDWKAPSDLDLAWVVTRGDEVVAAGDSLDFLYIEPGPTSFLGRLRRVLLRIPYCQNETQWTTLGLAGSATSSRGIGSFEFVAGDEYSIAVTAASAHPALTDHGVTLVVRPDRRIWNEHFASVGPLAYAALLALALGVALLALGAVRRRSGSRTVRVAAS